MKYIRCKMSKGQIRTIREDNDPLAEFSPIDQNIGSWGLVAGKFSTK